MSFQISFNDIRNSLGKADCWEVYQLRVHSEAWQHYEKIGSFESYLEAVSFLATLNPNYRYELGVPEPEWDDTIDPEQLTSMDDDSIDYSHNSHMAEDVMSVDKARAIEAFHIAELELKRQWNRGA